MKSGLPGIAVLERHYRTFPGVRSFCALVRGLLPVLALVAAMTPCARAASPAQGDRLVNTVSVTSTPNPVFTASASVTVIIPTPATIEFLQYAPGVPTAQLVPVAPGAYRNGGTPTSPFVALPPPQPVGFPAPVDLNQPVPLVPATQIHQGEPLFIRVTDLDQNMDRALRETIQVTITNPVTGDTEVIRLTETGPDTGVFVGYLPTTHAASAPFSGALQVSQGNRLTARYVDPDDATDTVASAIMVDPYGIVFDSSTGLPVSGATIKLVNTVTGQPATVFGDDGVSTFPASITSGVSATDSSGASYVFPAGSYRFPFVGPGSYRYDIVPPAGYSAPSTVASSAIQSLPGAPFVLVNGSRGEIFIINPGPALRIDIPLDPAGTTIWVQKVANKELVAIGEFVPYELTVTNTSTLAAVSDVRLTDVLPVGFRLSKGSVQVDGVPSVDPAVSADGRTLTFPVGNLPAKTSRTVRYVAEVTAGSSIGQATNQASATAAGGMASNLARATVKVRDDLLRTRSILMGRVTVGACPLDGDDPATGKEGVRIYLEDGTFVVSDKQGLFHFEGVRPGLHVVQLDLDSLPDGYEAFACSGNSRFAGRAFSQFVETQGGTLWRTDFHIRSTVIQSLPRNSRPLPSRPRARSSWNSPARQRGRTSPIVRPCGALPSRCRQHGST